MRFYLIAAAGLLAASSAGLAQQAEMQSDTQPEKPVEAAVSTNAPSEEEDPGQEIVCRTERVTGSLTRRRRTCMTRDEWNGVAARTRHDLNRASSRSSGGAQCTTDQFGGC